MSKLKSVSIVIGIIVLLLVYSSIYTVSEGQTALLLHLGQLVRDNKTGTVKIIPPGLHCKWPIVDRVKIFDTRLQTLDTIATRVSTSEKKDVLIDYFIKWQITNLPLYYTRTDGNAEQANVLLQQELNDNLRSQSATRTTIQIITDSNNTIATNLLHRATTTGQNLGLKVVDVRITKVALPPEMMNAVFDRMRAGRQQIAAQFRSSGKAQAETIRANADAAATIAIANATTQAAGIRAEGDAAAAKLYADAYNQDPGFYAFYRSITAYQNSFNSKNDILVLKPDGQFFKYFNNSSDSSSLTKKPKVG